MSPNPFVAGLLVLAACACFIVGLLVSAAGVTGLGSWSSWLLGGLLAWSLSLVLGGYLGAHRAPPAPPA